MVRTFIISLFMAFLLIPLTAFSDDSPDPGATPVSITVGSAGGNSSWR